MGDATVLAGIDDFMDMNVRPLGALDLEAYRSNKQLAGRVAEAGELAAEVESWPLALAALVQKQGDTVVSAAALPNTAREKYFSPPKAEKAGSQHLYRSEYRWLLGLEHRFPGRVRIWP